MKTTGAESRSSRRAFLLSAAALGALTIPGGLLRLGGARRRRRTNPRSWVPPAALAAAARIGQIYLRSHPETDEIALRRAVELRLRSRPADGLDDPDLRARLRDAVESDFADERVVRIGRVVFAELAAQLCALIALEARAEPAAPTQGSCGGFSGCR
jgi:hypothetical protein